MKIAAITDDGQTISQHFGPARHFLVVTDVANIDEAVRAFLEGRMVERPELAHSWIPAGYRRRECGHAGAGPSS